MKKIIGLGVLLSCWGVSFVASAETTCESLSKKICVELGKSSFHCGAYSLVARHQKASQSRCGLYIKNWKSLLKVLKRKEGYLVEMDGLVRTHGAQARVRVEGFKKQELSLIIRTMTSGDGTVSVSDAMACAKLLRLVCGSLGAKSMYCGLFGVAVRAKGVKPSRCQLLQSNWALVQRGYYVAQEKRMVGMMKKGKNSRVVRKKIIALQSQELQRLRHFLTR